MEEGNDKLPICSIEMITDDITKRKKDVLSLL